MSTHRDLKNAQQALNEAARGLIEWQAFPARWFIVEWDEKNAELLLHLEGCYREWNVLRMQFDGDRPAVARDTSIAAAKTRPLAAGTLRRRVVQAIVARWKLYQAGMTTDELEVLFKRSHQSVSSAVHDMETKGWIKDSKLRRVTRSRCKAIVYVPTDLALSMIEEGG